MRADRGSFHALGARLLREAFPALGPAAVDGYLRRADARIPSPPEPLVLVIDDEEDLRDIMRRMLERRGLRTLTAAGAAEALRLCRDHPGVIDFALADLGLPGIDEFTSGAAAARPDLRVVFLSGLPREIAVRDHLIGPDDILLKKPFATEDLMSVLREPSRRS